MTSLSLLQLVSPALPVGGFSYSEGLEVQIQAGNLADEQALEDWLEAEIIRGSLRLEAASLVTLANDCSAWVLHGDAQDVAAPRYLHAEPKLSIRSRASQVMPPLAAESP